MHSTNTEVTKELLIEKGILTCERIRKFPLKLYNLKIVLKAYAIANNLPYTFVRRNDSDNITDCYMTDAGLEWFYAFLRSKSVPFIKRMFPPIFSTYVEGTPFEEYECLRNFQGVRGYQRHAGTSQRALVTRKIKRCTRKYYFDTIAQAREQLHVWLRYYPADEFTIYRIRTKDGYDYKEEIPLLGGAMYNFGK